MSTIILDADLVVAPEHQGVWGPDIGCFRVTKAAQGLRVTATHDTDIVEHIEQVPARLYSEVQARRPIVVPINGRRYAVKVDLHGMDEDSPTGRPEGATVYFTPTTRPETPYRTWDEVATTRHLVKTLTNDLEEVTVYAANDPEFAEEEIARLNKKLADLASGTWKLRPHAHMRFFGTPDFLQGSIFPALNGVAAQCLMVIENDWGDCGNVNLLFACDEKGIPCRVWFEANCL